MQALQKLSQSTLKLTPIVYNTTRYSSNKNSIPNPHYDQLINEAGRARNFRAVQKLLMKHFRDGCFNTSNTFKFISSDLTILDDLLHSLAGLSYGFPKKSSHDCLVMQLSKLNCMPEALHVADVMVRNNYGANACTFHPILIRLIKKKEMDEAWRVLQQLMS